MKMLANKVKNYPGENPFGDYQGRNFPDKKVCSQFYPIFFTKDDASFHA